jgi:serine/threonine protein kinase
LLKRYPTKGGEACYNKKISGFRSLRQADSVIKFYGSYIYRDSYNILLEFADKGSLEDYFRRESPPSRGEDIIKFWERLFQLIKVLKAIHFVFGTYIYRGHFDVRPENILVVSKGAESADWLFKFAGFGASNAKDGKLEERLSKANEMKECATYGQCTHHFRNADIL